MIYVGRRYTSRVSGSVLKGAYCENCECEYLYKMVRTAEGQGSSPYYLDNAGAERRAQESAINSLTAALKGVDAVPCPDCGWYQKNMLWKMGGSYGWLIAMWVIGAFATFICYQNGLAPFLYSASITIFFFALWRILKSSFNPNLKAASRVKNRPRGVPEAILRSVLEPQLPQLEEGAQGALRRAFDEIDAAKAKLANTIKPSPMDPGVQEMAEADRKRRMLLQFGALALFMVAAFLVIGPFTARKAESDAYAKATVSKSNMYAIESYLRDYPAGPHAQELREARDDLRFELASVAARSSKSPQSLRDYLASKENTRHRDEATQLRREMYLAAVAKVENLPHSEAYDAAFAGGIVAALKSQVDVDAPVIPIAVVPTYVFEPRTAEHKEMEIKMKQFIINKYPDVQKLIEEQPASNHIIEPGELNAPQVEATRLAFIVSRIQEMINQAAGCQLAAVNLQPKSDKAAVTPALIEFTYRVRPYGGLNAFTFTNENPRPWNAPGHLKSEDPKVRLAGFVRNYLVEWGVRFNVPNFVQPGPVNWSCAPEDEFEFRSSSQQDHADWQIYAGMLHHATYRAGQIMFTKLGLPEPTIPKTYGVNGPQ